MGLEIGPLACSSKEAARPSQNMAAPYTRLMTEGALRPPFCARMPVETGRASVKPCSGAWQLAQETEPSEETRLSKNNSQPSSALAGVYGLSSGQTIGTSPRGIEGPLGGNMACVFT